MDKNNNDNNNFNLGIGCLALIAIGFFGANPVLGFFVLIFVIGFWLFNKFSENRLVPKSYYSEYQK